MKRSKALWPVLGGIMLAACSTSSGSGFGNPGGSTDGSIPQQGVDGGPITNPTMGNDGGPILERP